MLEQGYEADDLRGYRCGIGRQLFEQAVAAGHEVTAVARHPENLPVHPANVSVVTADLSTPDLTVLAGAVNGADAVLSGLGPRNPRTEAGITSRGTGPSSRRCSSPAPAA